MFGRPSDFYDFTAGEVDTDFIDTQLDTLMGDHGFNGVHISVFCEWWDIDTTTGKCTNSMTTFDQRTFDVLEAIITRVYDRGGMTHLWMYGDSERSQNPQNFFGFNSTTELNVINEIGTQLAPLDGWSMGYGFDLPEWTNSAGVQQWETNMRQAMGANQHMLGARGCKNSYGCDWSSDLDYYSVEWHKPTCQDYLNHVTNGSDRPAMSEDRFRVRDENRAKDYTEAETLQGLIDSHNCGGVGAIWGQLITPAGASGEVSGSYGNAAALKAEIEGR